jgi:Flp pilus assembly protein CpaB
MRRSPRVLAAWAAAIVVALTTARVVSADLATLHRRAADLGRERAVVVTTRDLPIGATVEAHDVDVVRRYGSAVPETAAADPEEVVGRVVVVPLLREAVVTTRALAAADRTGLDAVVPAGSRAVHVIVADGFRPPRGAVVDVLATFDPTVVTVEGPSAAAVVVASAARVVAVDDGESVDTGGAGVTLLVTEAEARAVAFAATNAELSLALAPPETACCTSSSP